MGTGIVMGFCVCVTKGSMLKFNIDRKANVTCEQSLTITNVILVDNSTTRHLRRNDTRSPYKCKALHTNW